MASPAEIEEFMQEPLVTWLKSCLDNPEKLQDYDDLVDGFLIHQVFLLIDPEPVYHGVVPSLRNSLVRVKNMSCIIKNIKALYEEELKQYVIAIPNCIKLGQKPDSKEGLEDMRLLLLLLLGFAVQCPNKLSFIERIKTLSTECQHTLVHCIQQVTDSQEIVLSLENCENLNIDLLLKHIKRLLKDRDLYFQLGLSAIEEKRSSISANVNTGTDHQCQHLAGELADWKTKLRKMRQELEEKSEQLVEARDELDRSNVIISKLKSEMQELKQEARICKTYRDEVDVLRDKAERCDRLESEVIKYREKLGDLEYYKSRIDEMRKDYRVLEETKDTVEEQLAKTKKRAEYALELESKLVQHQRIIDEITLERDAKQEKLQDLIEENTRLRLLSKTSPNSNNSLSTINIDDPLLQNNFGSSDNSLSEQLSSNAQTRILKLELENKKLLAKIDTLQDNAFHRNNERILELEREKKKLSLQVENLEDGKKKYMQQIGELETALEETQSQLKRVQESYQMLQEQLELRCDDAEFSNKERIRLREKISEMTNEIDNLKQKANNDTEISEMQNKTFTLEKEVAKLKRSIEESNVTVDRLGIDNETLVTQRDQLLKQVEDLNVQLQRLSEIEKDSQELEKQHKIDLVTITNLQNDLVSEKLKTQQLKDSFDALGLAIDNATDPDKVLHKIASNPEVLKVVRERIAEEQLSDSVNQTSSLSNAKLQVNIITLQSQISSLTSQHTALQLANSQLVAEKEDAIKELNKLKSARQQLVEDQEMLQRLHEQLNMEYDSLIQEREMLKVNLKDARAEKRNLQDTCVQLKAAFNALEGEKENFEKESQSLINLRTEHSKLKNDFRKLFTDSEKLKVDYRGLQEEYKKVRSEAGKLKSLVNDLKGELALKADKISSLELEISKLTDKCQLLVQRNDNLEDDHRALRDHLTILFSQYHALLTYSLEDKEHYHSEEKLFADQVNNLRRQKEKLEEKIMDYYKRSDSCSNKKKGFGASIVRRMKKAGSELMNKSRKISHEESTDRRTDSDSSNEDNQPKQAIQDMDDNLSCLSVPGTRRTLYLSGNETVDADEESTVTSMNDCDDFNKNQSIDNTSSTPYQDQRPSLLVYNRLTAKVGGKSTSATSPTPSQQNNKESASESNENVKNSVWYEYGCV